MKRLMEKTVFWGLVTAWRLATVPTSRSPSLVKPTTEGVVRPPSALGMTTGSPPSITATTELVVPRSIPITLSAILSLLRADGALVFLISRPRFFASPPLRSKHGAVFFCHIGRVRGHSDLLSHVNLLGWARGAILARPDSLG